MRIVVLSLLEDLPWGGSEDLWYSMAERAARDGHRVAVSVRAWPDPAGRLDRLRCAGVEVWQRFYTDRNDTDPGPGPRPLAAPKQHLPGRAARWSVRRMAAAAAAPTLDPRLADFHPDVVCVNQGVSYDIARPEVASQLAGLRCPYVVLTHGVDDRHDHRPGERERLRHAFGGAAAAGFSCRRVRHGSERQLAMGIPAPFVFANPVARRPAPLPWPGSAVPQVAYVGRVTVAKGIDALFEALRLSMWSDEDFRLRAFGERHQQEYFDDLARFYGLEGRVQLCGVTDDVERVWAEHQLLLFPSRMEGAPMALAEAMTCGRPALATHVGMVPEWLTDGSSGFLAPSAEPAHLAATLDRAWMARDRWEAMGRRAHQDIAPHLADDPAGDLLGRLVALGG